MRPRPSRWGRAWSPEDAAAELQRRRPALTAELSRRPAARCLSASTREEVVNDAMAAVVMESRPILNEEHLLGAFWKAADFRVRRCREGRHLAQLGSRDRVELDASVEAVCAVDAVSEQVELVDRMRRAADWFAELDERERLVVSVMASREVGSVMASRLLGLSWAEVRSASRSARIKLDQVAAIAAAGRMCNYRYGAIAAEAAGGASEHEARAARAHLDSCSSCGVVYRGLRREMGPDWQRRAAAALAPAPVAGVGHAGWLAKVSAWLSQRPSLPRGAGERTAEVAGGAGVVKVAAAGTALVVAGGALTGHIVHAIEAGHTRARHHARVVHVARASVPAASRAVVASDARVASVSPSRAASRPEVTWRHRVRAAPQGAAAAKQKPELSRCGWCVFVSVRGGSI